MTTLLEDRLALAVRRYMPSQIEFPEDYWREARDALAEYDRARQQPAQESTQTGVSSAAGDDRVLMPRALTAENGAKAAMIGEFTTVYAFSNDVNVPVTVSWTTIKEIYAKAVEIFATPRAEPQPAQGGVGYSAGIKAAADWVRARHDAWFSENGYVDPDTNAVSFGTGSHAHAKEEYSCELTEIEEGIRALATSAENETMSTELYPQRICKGCGKPLLLENLGCDDGCPCNSNRAVNFRPADCSICSSDSCIKPAHLIVSIFDGEHRLSTTPAPAPVERVTDADVQPEYVELTDEQCYAFLRSAHDFNGMLRSVHRAGFDVAPGRANIAFANHYRKKAEEAIAESRARTQQKAQPVQGVLSLLIDAWRISAKDLHMHDERAAALENCADELEAALASPPNDAQESGR